MFTLLFEKYMIILGSFSNSLYYSCIIINHFCSLIFSLYLQVAVWYSLLYVPFLSII